MKNPVFVIWIAAFIVGISLSIIKPLPDRGQHDSKHNYKHNVPTICLGGIIYFEKSLTPKLAKNGDVLECEEMSE